ncbi:hypothetical protein C7B82_17495 [Stenomitos frigidus ULC18]|uniref:Uncharacterized protein n=1 Tax=Stenomitos frigidus ULC18 TaxID=2107698 RepID=A0A2T1E2I3_9CYAN|nr:hypothetical protein C7B82_17495 [Stenomitos frigidus ULC18]
MHWLAPFAIRCEWQPGNGTAGDSDLNAFVQPNAFAAKEFEFIKTRERKLTAICSREQSASLTLGLGETMSLRIVFVITSCLLIRFFIVEEAASAVGGLTVVASKFR